jgi:hypothetical protein
VCFGGRYSQGKYDGFKSKTYGVSGRVFRKNFVGGKCGIMNGETKDWEEKKRRRGGNVQNWRQKYPYDRRNREIISKYGCYNTSSSLY